MYTTDLINEINDLCKQVVDRNDRLKCLLDLNVPAIPALCSPPIVCQRIVEFLDDPKKYRDEIIAIISHDPGLTARVLKAANNVPYASTQKVDDIHDAVSVLKEADLRTLITSITAVESFNHVNTDLVDMDNFWNHSICCGLAARVLAEQCGQANPDQAFVAGVLHDIGQLVIYCDLPELATEVLKKAGAPEAYRYRAEKEIIGITHAEVGAKLIRS
ncbi:MAG: HDOD domain-containing protein, partial [Gammaproteobacteria bacterium]|nr:HDOD domain-containing protein [Gammaproteobacteria bacterium]